MSVVTKMPAEVKQRKKTAKQSDGASDASSADGRDEARRLKTEAGDTAAGLDVRSLMCVLSLAACGALSW